MPRHTVKLLLVDPEGRLLLVHGRDPATGARYWYPVGGGVEPGETLQEAAAREAWEETGLDRLPVGAHVWTRDLTYVHAGRAFQVHEDWLRHAVACFDPAPARLTDDESESILGFRWWAAHELRATQATVYPPDLGSLLGALQEHGCPSAHWTLEQLLRDALDEAQVEPPRDPLAVRNVVASYVAAQWQHDRDTAGAVVMLARLGEAEPDLDLGPFIGLADEWTAGWGRPAPELQAAAETELERYLPGH